MKYLYLFSLFSGALALSNNTDPQNATTFALLYGYPLLAWQQYYASILEANSANLWYHRRQLSTPADRQVVKPNVDT
jgi:hypothetical protein